MKFTEFIKKWNAYNAIETCVQTLNEDEMIKANTNQLMLGKKQNDSNMPMYSITTLRIKSEEGGYISDSGRIALKNYGNWYSDLFVEKKNISAEIDNKDQSLTEKLTDIYGEEIMGVPDKSKQDIIDISREDFINETKKKLGL